MTQKQFQPLWVFILFPAIAMLLGWGLRGYIGGGPYGALIPGSFVALAIALLLGYRMETAALAALFGAVGVGYGGNMTYGQTLGFLHETDTVYWGLLGCLLKGGVWGLLGGAVLGIGLTRDQYKRKTLIIGFIITLIAFYIGVKLINEPKLLYFSDRVNKPRDESWAGLLFAALALLGWLRFQGTREEAAIPVRFALWGMLGGVLGFGGGAVWMVIGPGLPIPQQWIGWWKMMEFSFGFIFGACLGACAYVNRKRLAAAGQKGVTPPAVWGPFFIWIASVIFVFLAFPLLMAATPEEFLNSKSFGAILTRDVLGMLLGFVFLGGLSIVLGLFSLHVAWQVAITLTFFHTVLDFVRDLGEAKNFGYELAVPWQILILILATALVGWMVYRLQKGPDPVRRLFLLVLWTCYATSCVRSFARKELLFPPDGESALSVLIDSHAGIFFVHGTFTVSAIITTCFILWAIPKQPAPQTA